jgi:hypothetical protein
MTFTFTLKKKLFLSTIFALVGLVFAASHVFAASYTTTLVSYSGSGDISMQPGERKEILVEFLNTSDVTWENDGPGYVSLYTYGPKYRKSVFDPATWLGPGHVKRIREVSVAPGEKASVLFELHAPETEGEYEEVFRLASEDVSWFDGGEFSMNINVAEDVKEVETIEVKSSDSEDDAGGLSAEVTVTSANKVKAKAGKTVLFTVGFTNTGTTTWSDYGLYMPDVTIASTSASFEHPSWSDGRLAYLNGSVAPGEMGIISFAFNAPDANGSHTASFQLKANGMSVPGALIDIPVEVTGGSAVVASAPVNEAVDTSDFVDEPILRVGVIIVDEETDDEVVITSDESDFELRDINENVLARLTAGEKVTAYYTDHRYYYDIGEGVEKSSYALRFVPEKENAVMRIDNFDRRLTRGSSHADNEFRNILELRYNDYKDRIWVINELPMEQYLQGLAETSNISHEEYQKSLITAARTFAYYHYTRNSKRVEEFMHVTAYSEDQVYGGYGREVRSPRIVDAVEKTRGKVVTYDGELAITPYFSRSDGRTRDWSDVWWGDQPWARSVSVPCDVGKTLWGHGVGMSASGALCMANDGDLYEDILKHFYTGIELDRRWE